MFVDFIKNIKINDGFWSKRLGHVMDETLPYQWKALNDLLPDTQKSGAVANFKMIAGEIEKGEYSGYVFQDSDLYKWLEAVAYSLMIRPDSELEKTIDEVIDLIGRTQWEDGYINSSYTLRNPDKRWTNLRDDHELYCAGHMFEAAAAYYIATGKKKFIEISHRFVEHIIGVIGPEEGKLRAYPGHEEIELALMKLYKITGDKKYFELAKYFIDERGREPSFFMDEAAKRAEAVPEYMTQASRDNPLKYNQSHLPVREQSEAVGHSVRAMYLYSGMTDVAVEANDEGLKNALRKLWKNVTEQQMYITGGIGSQKHGEAFTFAYDLPNDETYSETCAQIGLFLWAHRMFEMERTAGYADVMERTLYNGIISGVSLDGKKFFYTNPLEIVPYVAEHRHDKLMAVERQGWFPCSCCPPNLARIMLSLGSFVYSVSGDDVYVNLYIGSEARIKFGDNESDFITITQKSSYETDGRVRLVVETPDTGQPRRINLKLRVPYWADDIPEVIAEGFEIRALEDGYISVSGMWAGVNTVEMSVKVRTKLIAADDRLIENAGRVAITRGPLVYCLEEIDNGENLSALSIDPKTVFTEKFDEDLLDGIISVECRGYRRGTDRSLSLYTEYRENNEEAVIKAVPYYAWGNRGVGEMRVWVRI